MLVLSRKINESIIMDGEIRVTVTAIRGTQVRLSIEAPPDVRILRQELLATPAADASERVRLPDRPARVLRNGLRRPPVARNTR